ncbi:hypothetical protein JCM10207_004494 [Rhodosporidiobolus poonsookiae]
MPEVSIWTASEPSAAPSEPSSPTQPARKSNNDERAAAPRADSPKAAKGVRVQHSAAEPIAAPSQAQAGSSSNYIPADLYPFLTLYQDSPSEFFDLEGLEDDADALECLDLDEDAQSVVALAEALRLVIVDEVTKLQQGKPISPHRLGAVLYLASSRYDHSGPVPGLPPLESAPFRPMVEYLLALPLCKMIDELPFPMTSSIYLPALLSWSSSSTAGSCSVFRVNILKTALALPPKGAAAAKKKKEQQAPAKKPATVKEDKPKPTSASKPTSPSKTSTPLKMLQELNKVKQELAEKDAELREKDDKLSELGAKLEASQSEAVHLAECFRGAVARSGATGMGMRDGAVQTEETESPSPSQEKSEQGLAPSTEEPAPSPPVAQPDLEPASAPPSPPADLQLSSSEDIVGAADGEIAIGECEGAVEPAEALEDRTASADCARENELEAALRFLKQENQRLRTTLSLTSSALASATADAAPPSPSHSPFRLDATTDFTASPSGASTPLAAPTRSASKSTFASLASSASSGKRSEFAVRRLKEQVQSLSLSLKKKSEENVELMLRLAMSKA